MLGIKLDSSPFNHPSKTFSWVRYVLLGFDPIYAHKVRSKLANGGAVDVGHYGPDCTHVIVDKLVYDDPICAAARSDGKTLVTGLWVDHSFAIGMPDNPNSILYRPLRDLNGIPGANSLIVCLTGYQRQQRDDVMTMVGLMGAHFSKPLVATKVTHLICYKFEGEKYELAKKVKTIKLVNHQWLEDCLRAWEIIPEANYDKSGYELEMMEAEAKDSEGEAESNRDTAKFLYQEKEMNASPHNLQMGMTGDEPHIPKEEVSRNLLDATATKDLTTIGVTGDIITTGKGIISRASALNDIDKKHPEVFVNTLSSVNCTEPSEQSPKPYSRSPVIAKVGNDLASTSGATKSSSETAKLSAKSYSRKTTKRTSLPMPLGHMENNVSCLSTVNVDKLNVTDCFDICSSNAEQAKSGSETYAESFKTPLRRTDILQEIGEASTLSEKRKLDVSGGISKSQKISTSPKAFISEGSPVSKIGEELEHVSLFNGPIEICNHISPGNNARCMANISAQSHLENSPGSMWTSKSSSSNRSSPPQGMPISKTLFSRLKQGNNAEEPPPISSVGLKRSSLPSKSDTADVMRSQEHAVGEIEVDKELLDVEVPCPGNEKLEIEKSSSPANLDMNSGGNAASLSKPCRRKTIAKTYVGSRSKLSTSGSANQQGSIYLNRTAPQTNNVTSLIGRKDTPSYSKFVNPEKLEMVHPAGDADTAMAMETNDVPTFASGVENKTSLLDDKTEATEDKEDLWFEARVNMEKSGQVEPANMADILIGRESDLHLITDKTNGDVFGTHDGVTRPGVCETGTGLETAISGSKTEIAQSACKDSTVKERTNKGKGCKLSKMKKKSVPSTTEIETSNEGIKKAEANSKKYNGTTKKMERDKSISHQARRAKHELSVSESENCLEMEKENRPVVCHGVKHSGKLTSKSNPMLMQIDIEAAKASQDSVQVERVAAVNGEPVWFILSGHKLQRKEFQQVIRRLKGRVCRDSHQWSYQATHFIVPDPLRRTEKFFAAAASGRWILKTDYLTASNQAGRFLTEEPYEWHGKSLSEDGSISLEAPRKWRLLRERTGHGALYGMRIIIYGECIAPPLDTLKRVIKAGDGTILATSPPYTRFLKSGVDFAIVSPGMPRVDMWVQEFLRYEIPCVVADYLVEYVCKPGYSLERHVQYNTHPWAERSFAKLVRQSEEMVEHPPPGDEGRNDPPCRVCGSRDRGEVMLICGDESGSTGCGVGTHIDCCDPPLDEVPEEEWFCPKCSRSRNNTKATKITKKKRS